MITPGTRASVNDICNTYNTLSQSGEHPVILMPRTAQCTEVNKALLQQTGMLLQPSISTTQLFQKAR